MFRQVLAITGMPRSGTSWLAQIFNSAPDVRFRMEPIFSYAFKDAVGHHSTRESFANFFQNIYESNDAFMRQLDKRQSGQYPEFSKEPNPKVLVFKTTRYHNIFQKMLAQNESLKMISIVRNPCGAINSWLNTPSEFTATGSDPNEWRHGKSRNQKEEEFWGFEDWKKATLLHLQLQREFSERFRVVRYEQLVNNPVSITRQLFEFCDIEFASQTRTFLDKSHGEHDERPYAVFKSKNVADKWRHQLSPQIIDEIHVDLRNSELEQFLQ